MSAPTIRCRSTVAGGAASTVARGGSHGRHRRGCGHQSGRRPGSARQHRPGARSGRPGRCGRAARHQPSSPARRSASTASVSSAALTLPALSAARAEVRPSLTPAQHVCAQMRQPRGKSCARTDHEVLEPFAQRGRVPARAGRVIGRDRYHQLIQSPPYHRRLDQHWWQRAMPSRVRQQRRCRRQLRHGTGGEHASMPADRGQGAHSVTVSRAGSEDCRPAARISDAALATRPGGRCR